MKQALRSAAIGTVTSQAQTMFRNNPQSTGFGRGEPSARFSSEYDAAYPTNMTEPTLQ